MGTRELQNTLGRPYYTARADIWHRHFAYQILLFRGSTSFPPLHLLLHHHHSTGTTLLECPPVLQEFHERIVWIACLKHTDVYLPFKTHPLCNRPASTSTKPFNLEIGINNQQDSRRKILCLQKVELLTQTSSLTFRLFPILQSDSQGVNCTSWNRSSRSRIKAKTKIRLKISFKDFSQNIVKLFYCSLILTLIALVWARN